MVDDSRRGLQSVLESMLCRVDAGHAELAQLRLLQQQKAGLRATAGAVLAHHCAATWGQRPGQDTVAVAALRTECRGGQWELCADLAGSEEELQPGGSAQLLAFAAGRKATLAGQRSSRGAAGGRVRTTLSASLVLDWGAAAPEELLLEVHVVLRRGGGSACVLPAGQLRLRLRDWLLGLGGAVGGGIGSPMQEQSPEVEEGLRHSISLAVQSTAASGAGELLSGRLQRLLREELGCEPGSGSAAGQVQGKAAALQVHSPSLAEVHLRAGSASTLRALRCQLERGLTAENEASGDEAALAITCAPSTLGAAHAAAAVRAAEAVLAETDACIAWLEGQLRAHEAAASHFRKRKLQPPEPGEAAALQAAALALGAEACASVAALV